MHAARHLMFFFACRMRRFVGRKVIKPQAFPITRWEFYGSTSLVEVAGYLEVPAPGSYEFAVSSEDRFVLWLQDWWLHMQEAGDDATGLPSGSWTTRVNFAARGESPGEAPRQCSSAVMCFPVLSMH